MNMYLGGTMNLTVLDKKCSIKQKHMTTRVKASVKTAVLFY